MASANKVSLGRRLTSGTAAIVLVVISAALLWDRLGPKPTLAQVASRSLRALEDNDGHFLFSHLDPSEIQALDLTPEKLTALCKLTAVNAKGSSAPWSPIRQDVFGGTVILSKTKNLGNGRVYGISITVNDTDHGPRIGGLCHGLYWKGIIEQIPDNPQARSGPWRVRAVAELGPAQNKAFQEIGITRLYISDGGVQTMTPTLEEFVALNAEKLRVQLEKAKAREEAKTTP